MAIYKRGSIYWYKFTFNGRANPRFAIVRENPARLETWRKAWADWSEVKGR